MQFSISDILRNQSDLPVLSWENTACLKKAYGLSRSLLVSGSSGRNQCGWRSNIRSSVISLNIRGTSIANSSNRLPTQILMGHFVGS